MSYQQRQALASLVSTILISVLYFAYVIPRFPQANPYSAEVFHFWGLSIVILIPLSITVNIALRIQFSIVTTMATNEKDRAFSDERDKLIVLRATRNSTFVFAAGFVLAMGSLVIDMPPTVMFIVLVLSGITSGMVADLSQLYLYRKGF